MVQTIGLILLCSPLAVPFGLGAFWLLGTLVRAYARSRHAWLASVLLLPHIASKVLDRIVDACLAGNLLDAAMLSLPLVSIVVALKLLLNVHDSAQDDGQSKTLP
ncbi:hypothetical protein [Acidovorax sp. sic0104]|uniref:hypothetical protein n=1 Tax=Acidovorax sp. sic0104 TaxID=2854784 RepID=UPI001C4546D3|nr:hypothetical protein [Acidovorax sp. sic0104]MBV7541940.1 hypothetical protein [Acidovorax sp. sic0104]